MKIAVATFGDRVSPRFDCAQKFLVTTLHDGRFVQPLELVAAEWNRQQRTQRLIALGVNVIVCGGIDLGSAQWLEVAGVKVYARRTGTIDEVLTSLVRELGANRQEA